MKTAVVVFPGSNCDRDMQVALRRATGQDPVMLWHKDTAIPAGIDLIALPGGFSFGDYLRCGAIASRSPIMREVAAFAGRGGFVLGVCNGFQVLVETGLLPGVLMRNATLKFVCRTVALSVEETQSGYTHQYSKGEQINLPVAHHDGCYVADEEVLKALTDQSRIALKYSEAVNGSQNDIAGILSENRRVLGMMPHPERAEDPALGNTDGARMFSGLVSQTVSA